MKVYAVVITDMFYGPEDYTRLDKIFDSSEKAKQYIREELIAEYENDYNELHPDGKLEKYDDLDSPESEYIFEPEDTYHTWFQIKERELL